MRKIMFNDQMGLTRAVLKGDKTMTRRNAKLSLRQDHTFKVYKGELSDELIENCINQLSLYKVGDIVAIAQNYQDAAKEYRNQGKPNNKVEAMVQDRVEGAFNKMFVKSDLMPHHIKITNIRMEQLQNISEEDCLKEGVYKVDFALKDRGSYSFRYENEWYEQYHTAQEAFAALIDKVSGKGTWESNPWVFIYEFDLVD